MELKNIPLTLFDRKKYKESLHRLQKRRAPDYVMQAYEDGHASVVNEYYRSKLNGLVTKGKVQPRFENAEPLTRIARMFNIDYLNEAIKVRDLEFIKAFFKMANLDLVSGNRLPPNAAALIKQGISKDMDLNKLFKKLT